MNNIKNWIIIVLGIIIIILGWRLKYTNEKLQLVISTSNQTISDNEIYINSLEETLDNTCIYIQNKYNEFLPDTIWEGTSYLDYIDSYSNIQIK